MTIYILFSNPYLEVYKICLLFIVLFVEKIHLREQKFSEIIWGLFKFFWDGSNIFKLSESNSNQIQKWNLKLKSNDLSWSYLSSPRDYHGRKYSKLIQYFISIKSYIYWQYGMWLIKRMKIPVILIIFLCKNPDMKYFCFVKYLLNY